MFSSTETELFVISQEKSSLEWKEALSSCRKILNRQRCRGWERRAPASRRPARRFAEKIPRSICSLLARGHLANRHGNANVPPREKNSSANETVLFALEFFSRGGTFA